MWNVIGIAGICIKPTKLDSLQKTHTSYYCLKQYIAKCLQSINKFLLMRVHHKVSRVPSRVASLDPSGLLDIASFICICSRVFSVVKVRQSEGEQGNPLLPRGIWTKTPVWLKLSLFCLAARAVLLCSTAGIYTPQSSLTAHLPVEIDSLCFLRDERLFEPLVAFEWTADILEVTEEFAASQSKSVQIFLTLPTRVFKLSLEKDLFTGSQLLCLCPSITLVSLSQSLRHFSYSVFYE